MPSIVFSAPHKANRLARKLGNTRCFNHIVILNASPKATTQKVVMQANPRTLDPGGTLYRIERQLHTLHTRPDFYAIAIGNGQRIHRLHRSVSQEWHVVEGFKALPYRGTCLTDLFNLFAFFSLCQFVPLGAQCSATHTSQRPLVPFNADFVCRLARLPVITGQDRHGTVDFKHLLNTGAGQSSAGIKAF